jgi:hypothetical protein
MTGTELAKKAGISKMLVSRKRQQGKSDAVILDEARARREHQAVHGDPAKRPGARKVGRKPGTKNRALSIAPDSPASSASPVSTAVSEALLADIESQHDAGENFFNAQRRKEIALANLRELEEKLKCGSLIEVDAVRVEWGKHISAVKNSLLLLPSKLAPKLASSTEVLKCQHLLDKALRDVLTELSDYQANAA